jgi:hypothetical protein
MNHYLCIEDNEQFRIEAENLAQAKEDASMWNASVIRKLTKAEVAELPES